MTLRRRAGLAHVVRLALPFRSPHGRLVQGLLSGEMRGAKLAKGRFTDQQHLVPLTKRGQESMHAEEEASRPHPGRMYDYIIGGTYNYEVDRLAADEFVKLVPSI